MLEAYKAIPEIIAALESDLKVLEAYLVKNRQIKLKDNNNDNNDNNSNSDKNLFISIKKRLGK